MCGIAGVITKATDLDESFDLSHCIEDMCNSMKARGPDFSSSWISENGKIGLGHRRLSIIDLDARANQPMQSEDERYIIVFNGEIYNFEQLKIELIEDGFTFRTSSDTEVILALYIRDGEQMLSKLRGMFSIVIFDNDLQKLFLARDPYGIKPLYVAYSKYGWLFASQVKALLSSGIVSKEPDMKGQASFWLLGSVKEPNTWFKDISSLPAGSWATIDSSGNYSGPFIYWDIGLSWSNIKTPAVEADIRENVKDALLESVQNHLVADVPIAIFLSGGIDSGTLAALMIECGITNLVGITLSYDEFEDTAMDEASIAAEIAEYYGIKHHVYKVTKEDFFNDLPLIIAAMDQPSIDGINTWYASKAAADLGLKVVVSGIGGDELFLGYQSFKQLPTLVKMMKVIKKFPAGLWIANIIARIKAKNSGNSRWKYAPLWLQRIDSSWWLRRSVYSPDDLSSLIGEENAKRILKNFSVDGWINEMVGKVSNLPELQLAQIESMTYLRNQLLRDSDWASMSHSIELRTPLVDAHLLSKINTFFPLFNKYSNKTLLSNSPLKPLPSHIISKPKTGFGIPINDWLVERNMISRNDSRAIASYIAEVYESKLL